MMMLFSEFIGNFWLFVMAIPVPTPGNKFRKQAIEIAGKSFFIMNAKINKHQERPSRKLLSHYSAKATGILLNYRVIYTTGYKNVNSCLLFCIMT
jgi:hypothetical protein